MKRAFDFVAATVGILALSPALLWIAWRITREDRGPIFYRGVRVGLNGRQFRIFKFRTMVVDEEKDGPSSTSGTDPRLTRIGETLRKYKVDEVPQLINVLLGDMSLVGPRPQVQWAVDLFSAEERKVLRLRPGITDWASIKFNDEGGIIAASGIADPDEAYMKLIHAEKMRLQLKYLKERSFWVDLKIIFQTLSSLFTTRFVQDLEKL